MEWPTAPCWLSVEQGAAIYIDFGQPARQVGPQDLFTSVRVLAPAHGLSLAQWAYGESPMKPHRESECQVDAIRCFSCGAW